MQVTRERTAEEAAADIASLLGGEAPDVCIECSGAEPSIRSESDQAYPVISVQTLVTLTNGNERVKKRNGRNHVILNRKKQME